MSAIIKERSALLLSMKFGKLIDIEGPNGAGKSTLIAALAEQARSQGIEVISTREPGGTALGEACRPIIKSPDFAKTSFASVLLFNACRAQLNAEVIEPALQQGAWVITDRYFHSTEIYQHHLGSLTDGQVSIMRRIHSAFVQPALTVFVIPSDEVIAARLSNGPRGIDCFEGNPVEVATYRRYAKAHSRHHPTLLVTSKDTLSAIPAILQAALGMEAPLIRLRSPLCE